MKSMYRSATRFFLILVFVCIASIETSAAQSGGRLIVLRTPNFGWNLALNLQVDGRTVANVVQGRRYDHFVPAGRHVLTASAVPNYYFYQPTQPFGELAVLAANKLVEPSDHGGRYLIFARISSISFRRKARRVWLFTLPSEPILSMNALIVSSLGASTTTTTS